VKPLWARRLKRLVPALTYFDLCPAGHCPHHEVPVAVNQLLCQWMDSEVRAVLPLVTDSSVAMCT
jgi:pimeloyl-ACP methyl ester carboxylesterase